MPGEKAIEIELRDILNKDLKTFKDKININESVIIQVLQRHDGENYHDWFVNVAVESGYSTENFVRVLYELWIKEDVNQGLVKKFFEELDKILSTNDKLKKFA